MSGLPARGAAIGVALTIAVAAVILSFRPVYEPDLGWHLAHGRENAAGRLVRTNVFSFTYPEYRQHYTSFLFDTGLYAAWALGGDTGVRSAQALILAAAFASLFLACRVRSPTLPSLAVLILGVVVLEPRAIPRPHLVSFVGMAACVWTIERALARRSVAPLAWAIPIVAVWSNAHGESVLGVLLIALFVGCELIRPSAIAREERVRALAIVGACVLALLATPYGWGLLRYMFENLSVPAILDISELRPAYLPTYRAFFVYAGVVLVAMLWQFRRITLWEAVGALVFGALGFRYLRLTPLLLFVTAPMLASRLTLLVERGLDARAVFVTTVAAAAVMSRVPVAAYVTQLGRSPVHPAEFFSSAAVQFTRTQGLGGPLFNSHNLGGWLAWELYPQANVFQDSRLQAYPPEHFARILEASRSQAVWDMLVRDVDWAVLSIPRPNQLSGAGRFPVATWATVFWDDAVEIVVRRSGRYSALARAREYQILTPDAEVSVLATQLSSPAWGRIQEEARRNREENPGGFTAVAVLCLADAGDACAALDRLVLARPSLEPEAALVRVLRLKR